MRGLAKEKKEWFLIAGLTLLAALLRFWKLTQLGLTHYDEGTFALTGKWVASFGRDGLIFPVAHAPGFFPALVGAFFLIFGVQDYAAIAASAFTGSLTVGTLYLIGRDWFDRQTGLLAALLLATAEYHLIYSRLALSDATFALFFWAAITCLWRGITAGERRWSIAGGVLTGLCWNTKYHGFFSLLITGLWMLPVFIFKPKTAPALTRQSWQNFSIAIGCAALLYLPWFLFAQFTVGYGKVLQMHRDSSALGGGWILTPPKTLWFYLSHWLSPALLSAAAAGVALILFKRKAAAVFLAAIFCFFMASALFYLSFPRLILPMIPAICLFAAHGARPLASRFKLGFVLAVFILLLGNVPGLLKTLSLKTTAYRQAAAYVSRTTAPVISQTSKNFYFYQKNRPLEIRRQNLAALDSLMQNAPKVFLVIDPIIQRMPAAMAWFEKYRGRCTRVQAVPVQMYEPVYYQGFDPAPGFEKIPRALAPFVPGQAQIEIYHFQNL
jgi:4-amino-4-deoxy-L-arabinose transferase-like glycosyltransferase